MKQPTRLALYLFRLSIGVVAFISLADLEEADIKLYGYQAAKQPYCAKREKNLQFTEFRKRSHCFS